MDKKKVIGALAGLGLGLVATGAYALYPTGQTVHGLYIGDVAVGNASQEDIKKAIEEASQQSKQSLTVVTDAGTQEVPLSDLGISVDVEATAKALRDYGYESSVIDYVSHRIGALTGKAHLPLVYKVDETKVHSYVEGLAKSLNQPGHDAYLSLNADGSVQIHNEEKGNVIPVNQVVESLVKQVKEGQLTSLDAKTQVQTEFNVTAAQLQGMTTVLASYTTNYDPSATNRSHNIEIASDKISGTFLAPDQEFSFNDIVGERTAEAGFDDAPVMLDGKLVPGVGGGICQVSSTLFNAALLSGMDITERTPHFEPVGYIPQGRDATVAWGYLDFKFKNPYKHPVYVLSIMSGGTLTIYIIGQAEDQPRDVAISVREVDILHHGTVTKVDDSQVGDSVEEGHDGKQLMTTRRVIMHDGNSYTDTFESIYDPVDTVITKGRALPDTSAHANNHADAQKKKN